MSAAFDRGFDHGNYAAAYETDDVENAIGKAKGAEREGVILGFFSSYEIHEVPEDYQDRVRALRRKWRQEA